MQHRSRISASCQTRTCSFASFRWRCSECPLAHELRFVYRNHGITQISINNCDYFISKLIPCFERFRGNHRKCSHKFLTNITFRTRSHWRRKKVKSCTDFVLVLLLTNKFLNNFRINHSDNEFGSNFYSIFLKNNHLSATSVVQSMNDK